MIWCAHHACPGALRARVSPQRRGQRLPLRLDRGRRAAIWNRLAERALTALGFGLDIRQPRFHVVVVGASGTGRTFCARSVAKRIAAGRPTPDDVLLLPNPRRPSRAHRARAPRGRRQAVRRRDGRDAHQDPRRRPRRHRGERYKQARAKIRRRVATEESRLEETLKSAARALGLDLTRGDDEVQITALDEAAGSRATTPSRRSPPRWRSSKRRWPPCKTRPTPSSATWCSTSSPRR